MELDPELAEAANANAATARVADRMHVHACYSTDLNTLPSSNGAAGATIIVSEVLDSGLIGEGVVSTLSHAVSTLAISGTTPIVIPSKANILVQAFQSDWLWAQHDVSCVVRTFGTSCSI